MLKTITLFTQWSGAMEREERRRCIPRGEGLSSDKSTLHGSPAKTFGRFSVRGPAAWRRMAVREKTVTRCPSHVKLYATTCPHSVSGTRSKLAPYFQMSITLQRKKEESVRKNSIGVVIRKPVRFATAGVKCLVLCVRSQSGRLAMAESSTGASVS